MRAVALGDFLTRAFAAAAGDMGLDRRTEGGGYHGPKGGELRIDAPGQVGTESTTLGYLRTGYGRGVGYGRDVGM